MAQEHTGTSFTPLPRVRIARKGPRWRISMPPSSIRGREQEMAALLALLDDAAVRLVTITGTGGIGKTRLAREVAVRLQGDFADGACFISFASVTDASSIVPTAVRGLELQAAGMRDLAALLVDTLRERHVLLVLDNLEHLADASAPWLAALLQRCPRITVLATSRQPLRIAGERRFVLEPLSLPPPEDDHALEGAMGHAAIALFTERAREIVPEFELTRDNVEAVARICRMLGGLPLAIELAAAQIQLFPPQLLATRLEGNLTGLAGERIDLPDRHQTMGAAIAWSYDLLTPEHQTLFRWLGVFPGGFSLDAATAIAGSAGVSDPDKALLQLVEHSLVHRRHAGPDGYRFGMLEVVRQVGLDQLERGGEARRAHETFARYVLHLSEQARVGLQGVTQGEWLDRLEDERENLVAALTWLREHDLAGEAAELAANTIVFRAIRGYDLADLPALEQLLRHADLETNDAARGLALLANGVARLDPVGFPEGVAALSEAIDIFRRLEFDEWLAMALQISARPLFVMGEIERGRAAAEECHRLGEALGVPDAQIMGLQERSAHAWITGDVEGNRMFLEQARQLAAEHGPPHLLGRTLAMQATRAFALGDYDIAETYQRASMEIDERLGARTRGPQNLQMAARIAHRRGDLESARDYYSRAVQAALDLGIVDLANEVAVFVGELERDLGHFAAAVASLRQAVSRREADSSPHAIGATLDQLAEVAMLAGDPVAAARFTGAADAIYEAMNLPRWPGHSTEQRAEREQKLKKILGSTQLARHYAAGKSLSTDEAVAELLAWQPEVDAREPAPVPELPELPEGLSPRELEVLTLMSDGLTNQEIADALFVTHRTAAAHASNIIGKLGVTSRTGAVAFAIRNGLA